MITIDKAYKCEFCRKLYQMKKWAIRHEERCKKNPQNDRPCFTCEHIDKIDKEFYFDTYHGEGCRLVSVLKCGKKDICVYPPSVEFSDKGPYEFGDILNEPMPKKCKDHLSIYAECKLT